MLERKELLFMETHAMIYFSKAKIKFLPKFYPLIVSILNISIAIFRKNT